MIAADIKTIGKGRGRGKTRMEDGQPNPTDLHVGARIRERRTELGLSQTELGRAIGLTLQQIQKYERGINRVSCSRLFDLHRALHVSVSYFFDGLEATGPVDAEAMDYETQELVRAYYGITDPRLRTQVCELAKALAPAF
jgi:transcriptional regulator with XRE-family HTH domain